MANDQIAAESDVMEEEAVKQYILENGVSLFFLWR
jgi:hypothetical protein